MSVTVVEAFTGSATISTTEFSLPNNSTTLTPQTTSFAGVLVLDLAAMAAGDEFRLQFYEKTRSGDTQRALFPPMSFKDAQSSLFYSVPVYVKNGWDMTLIKVAGTDRAINWSLRTV